jgi:hypothetical protein
MENFHMAPYRIIVKIITAIAIALGALASPTPAPAADPEHLPPGPWSYGATVGLYLSQSAFSNNWSGGDKGSVVWTATSDLTAERQLSRSFHLGNELKLAYGQTTRQKLDPQDPRERVWDVPEKTTDQILLESTGRFTLDSYLDPYVSFRGESQFSDQSNPVGSIPLNPIRLKESAGFARVFQKTKEAELISRLGFGFRQTLARSFVDTVTKEKKRFTANDGGFEWQTNAKQPLLGKRVLYKASLGVFKTVFFSKKDDLKAFDAEAADSAAAHGLTHGAMADFWKDVDVSFQNEFSAQITKVLSVNLFAQWVYDKFDASANLEPTLPFAVRQAEVNRTVRKAGQFKETLALGLTYRLF